MTSNSYAQRVTNMILFVMFGLLVWRLLQFLCLGIQALHWPYELDYGEGIVWQQANLMFTPQAYGPIDGWPAIVFHYPPFYHVVTRAVAGSLGINMLVSGRFVSLISALLIALLSGLIVSDSAPQYAPKALKRIAAVATGLSCFTLAPFIIWAPLMRVDMLAISLSLAGLYVGLKTFDQPKLIWIAVLFFVAAIYTKQTSVAAPISLFVVMLLSRPSLALKGIIGGLAIALTFLGALIYLTHGGFLRHIIGYNINQFSLQRLSLLLAVIFSEIMLIILSIFSLYLWIRQLRSQYNRISIKIITVNPTNRSILCLILYSIVSGASALMIAKLGSSFNYAIEWAVVVTMLAGLAFTLVPHMDDEGMQGSEMAKNRMTLIAPFAIILQAIFVPHIGLGAFMTDSLRAPLAALSERVRAARKPVISDEMVLLLQSGKPVLWEPAIFSQLARTGMWNEQPFINRIRAHQFAMFITDHPHDLSRYSPAVQAAIDAAYPHIEQQAGYYVHLPVGADDGKRAS